MEMNSNSRSTEAFLERRLQAARSGDADALYQIGLAYSCGAHGIDLDLIEAHKWLNLAGIAGSREARACRAQLAEEMTAREIADAQREARAWMFRHGALARPDMLRAAA